MFKDCNNLATVTIGGTLDAINADAFTECSTLSTLNIPGSIGTIGALTSLNLTSLNISGHVGTISANAFDDCTKLSSVTFESGSQDLHIGFQDHSSDKGTFYDSPFTYISLDRELVYDYDDLDTWDEGIFATPNYDNDDPVVTVTLGTNVKTILPWMFSCVRMQKVEIPTSVTYIGKRAFSYCYILTEVTCMTTTPPTLGEDVFLDSPDKNNNLLDIKVPYDCVQKYKSAWNQYSHRIGW